MTTREFSDEFDTLINANASINLFGTTASLVSFDEYEKSVLLTEAQEEIVKELYSGKYTGESFEKTEELRRSLDGLVKTCYPSRVTEGIALDSDSSFFTLPEDLWFITYESVDLVSDAYCSNKRTIDIVPMRQDEWHRAKRNPFRRPNKRKAVRLDSGNNTAEIISAYPIENYLIRYLSKPSPIVLVNLEDGLSINGVTSITECKLNTVLHRTILERAVLLGQRRLPQASK